MFLFKPSRSTYICTCELNHLMKEQSLEWSHVLGFLGSFPCLFQPFLQSSKEEDYKEWFRLYFQEYTFPRSVSISNCPIIFNV